MFASYSKQAPPRPLIGDRGRFVMERHAMVFTVDQDGKEAPVRVVSEENLRIMDWAMENYGEALKKLAE